MRNDLRLAPLQYQIRDMSPELLDQLIEEFSCAKEPDVESFLKTSAMWYERIGLSRTYLYITGEVPRRIAAYFTLAITATSFQDISRSRKEKVLGFKPGRNTKDHFGGLVVGQLARSDGFDTADINGKEMIEDAENISNPYPSGYYKMFKTLPELIF